MNEVRVGVVGCGEVLGAYMALAEELAARGAARVVAACGREHQRAFAQERLRIPRFTTDAAEVTGAPDVDLVLVLTPPAAHAAIAAAALRAGKHVLVEKPMAATREDAAALLDAARGAPGRLFCAPFTPLSPTFREVRRRVRAGDIGRVVSARARYGYGGPDWGEWFYREGGGPIFDLAVYNVTTLTALLGPVAAVAAATATVVPARQVRGRTVDVTVEDSAHLLLELGDGCLAAVTTGFHMQRARGPAVELYGTEGTLQILGDDWDPDGYQLWRRGQGGWQTYPDPDPTWTWTDGLRHAVACLRGDGADAPSPEHAFHVLDVLIAARASGRDGERKALASRFTPLPDDDAPAPRAHYLLHDRIRRLGD